MLKKQYILILVLASILMIGLFIIKSDNGSSDLQDALEGAVATEEVREDDDTISKVEIIKNNEESSNPEATDEITGKKTVEPFISYAGVNGASLEVNSYIPASDLGGDCTVSVQTPTGDTLLSETVDTLTDATTTVCKVVAFDTNYLPAGEVLIVVSYESENYQGNSSPTEVSVP